MMHRLAALALVVASAPARAAPPAFESRVVGEAQRRRESAEAVTVYGTTTAQRESADLTTVVNRIPGVRIASSGGLGAELRLTLNGLSNDQVRLFLDGAPLELAGFAFGLGAIPLAFVERVEVYRGVVPLRFGADALGGAINLVSPARARPGGAGTSLQLGSFSTFRWAGSAHVRHARTGLHAALGGFVDSTRNDYAVDVEVPDARGQLQPVRVPRFHDGYQARGLFLDVGLADAPGVRRLVARFFYSEYQKELQHNPTMTVPYGGVGYGESLVGGSLTVEQPGALGGKIDLDGLFTVSHRTTRFSDVSPFAYDWLGQPVRLRAQPGEIDGTPRQAVLFRDSVLARLGFAWHVAERHLLRATSTASYVVSRGTTEVGLAPGAPDPLAPARELWKIVSGVGWEARSPQDTVENQLFVKHYALSAFTRALPIGGSTVPVATGEQTAGAGEAIRLRLHRRALWGKLSYEYATRLPNQTEVFGDGILVSPSGSLRPEQAHNLNLGLAFDVATRAGRFDGEVNGFARVTRDLILLLGTARDYGYANVAAGRGLGVEGLLHYRSPGDWVSLELSLTYQDQRNVSEAGAYAAYRGDRFPNLPWLFLHASVRVQAYGLSLTWFFRFVESFYRDWESLGDPAARPLVPAQTAHTLSLGYLFRAGRLAGSATLDLDNVGDERLYDVFGVQRPGRAFHGKVALHY